MVNREHKSLKNAAIKQLFRRMEERSPWGHIPKADWDRVVQSEMDRLSLRPHATGAGAITGSRPLRNATVYDCHYHAFCSFAYSVGDYSSLLMFDPMCPTFCIPPCAKTMVAYCNSRLGTKGEWVKTSSGTDNFTDSEGNHVKCLGGWNDASRLDHFRAGINAVVTAHQQDSPYGDACTDCLSVSEFGCRFHRGRPLLYRHGNPCNSREFLNNAKREKSLCEWKVKGAGQLLPADLRTVLSSLVLQNSVPKLQIACLLLVCIKLFLRKEEGASMQVSDFVEKLTICKSVLQIVEAVNVQIQGKSDTHVVNMYLWLDNETPDLCPVRYLLVYIYCAGIKEGSIFPAHKELSEKPSDGKYTSCISDKELYGEVNYLWQQILKKKSKLGVHTCRKTGYLMACLGVLEKAMVKLELIMQAARHKTFATAKTYLQNAMSLCDNIRYQADPAQKVGKWRNPWVGDLIQNHEDVCLDSRHAQAPLYELARRFVEDILKIDKSHPKNAHPAYILRQAVAYQPGKGAQETLDEVCGLLDKTMADKIKEAVNSLVNQAMATKTTTNQNVPANANESVAMSGAVYEQQPIQQYAVAATKRPAPHGSGNDGNNTGPTEPTAKRCKKKDSRSGTSTLLNRASYSKKIPDHEKLKLMVQMGKEVEQHGGAVAFVNRDRQFATKYILPINKCLTECCDSDHEKFCGEYGTPFKHTDFEKLYKSTFRMARVLGRRTLEFNVL